MYSAAFQLNKVKRLINTQGRVIQVIRQGRNVFNEPNGEAEVFEVKGVFHETTSYMSKSGSNGSTVRAKSSPMFLCTWETAQMLVHNDQVTINGHIYNINAIKNLCEVNLIGNISLEEVQADGTS